MPDRRDDAANPPLAPPVYFFAFLIIGGAAQYIHRLDINRSGSLVHVWAGSSLIAAAVLVFAWGFRTLRAHGTTPDIDKPTTSLVTSGPFAFSRNPFYLALTALYAGLALVANSWWILALTPLLPICLHFAVVKHEESYLTRKFGDEYVGYTRRVRRWL